MNVPRVRLSLISLIYTRKSKGPRTVPCGTPDVTDAGREDSPSTNIDCFLEVRKEEIH